MAGEVPEIGCGLEHQGAISASMGPLGERWSWHLPGAFPPIPSQSHQESPSGEWKRRLVGPRGCTEGRDCPSPQGKLLRTQPCSSHQRSHCLISVGAVVRRADPLYLAPPEM